MATLFSQTKTVNSVNSFNKYQEYYDRKAKVAPLKLHDYCKLLSPKFSTEYEKISNSECKWTGLFGIEKILSRSNYLIGKKIQITRKSFIELESNPLNLNLKFKICKISMKNCLQQTL